MEIDSTQLTDLITGTLNEIIDNLFSSISNNIYSIMDDITFISEQILSDPNFQKILGSSSSDGILLIANSLLLGFIIYYAIRLFFSYYHQSQIQRPYQFLVRIFLIGIFMNSSYFICEKIIALNHILSSSIRNLGEILFQKSICFSSLISELNAIINIQSQNFDLLKISVSSEADWRNGDSCGMSIYHNQSGDNQKSAGSYPSALKGHISIKNFLDILISKVCLFSFTLDFRTFSILKVSVPPND